MSYIENIKKEAILEDYFQTKEEVFEDTSEIEVIFYRGDFRDQQLHKVVNLEMIESSTIEGLLIYTRDYVYTLICNDENDFVTVAGVPRDPYSITKENFIGIHGV